MIKLHFEKLSRYERLNEPCSIAIPFPKGKITDLSKLAVIDGSKIVPVQFKITAKWEDASVKWILVNFLADLPGNKSKDYFLKIDNMDTQETKNSLIANTADGRLCINAGELQIKLNRRGETGVFHSIKYNNALYEKDSIIGPSIYDITGKAWNAHIGKSGWEIIEEGPVYSVVETRGKHMSLDNEEWIDYCIKLYVYAGKPWIRMDYQILNAEADKYHELNAIDIRIKNMKSKGNIKTALATSNYNSKIVIGDNGEILHHLIDANQLIFEANEHIPEVFYGTFWADWNDDEKGGICATIYQAHQNFPKAMEVDNTGIKINILPLEAENLKLCKGVAKTHRIFLHFHNRDESLQNVNVRSLQFQMPDRPILDASVYENAKIFEDVFVEKKIDKVERSLIYKADARGKAYGILHWGDAPDPGYTQQGRGNGEPVWTNNEYDFPHAAMLMYARSGERRMLDYMLVTAEHWMDVDVCHYSEDPLRYQAQIIHSAGHISGEVEASHEWVEGLLDYYHVTGEERAFQIAIGIGKNVLRQLEQPRYKQKGGINARETGWALRTLVALYKETYDEKWLAPSEKIVEHFEVWKEEYGEWLAPYTDHTAIRVPFMISVAVGSLMRYYRIRPQERIKEMIIAAVKDMIDNCILDNGLFFYKELPSLRRLGNNTLVLEALTVAYELTGDSEFLKYGLPTFNNEIMNSGTYQGGSKQIVGDALILTGPGPKGFAQSFYPIVTYYRAAANEGILSINVLNE